MKKLKFSAETVLYVTGFFMLLTLLFVVKQKVCQNDSTGDLRSTFWFLGCGSGETAIDSASTD